MHPVTVRLIRATPAPFRPGVELVMRTIDDAVNDRVPGLSAEIAFFVLLSLPPLLLTVFGTLGLIADWFPVDLPTRILERTLELSSQVFTDTTIASVIEPTVRSILTEGSGRVATFGFLLTIYSASRALKVVATAITIAYDLEETRPAWQQRIWGLGLTVTGILLGLVVVPAIVAGPDFGRTIAAAIGASELLGDAYRVLYWPVAGTLAWLLIASLYHVVAPWWTPWRRDLPGAAIAMLLWLAGSFGLRFYTQRTFAGDSIYEPIAGPLILLLWLYVSGFAVLIGAELNAEIEAMWPSKRPGQPPQEPDRIDDHSTQEVTATGDASRS